MKETYDIIRNKTVQPGTGTHQESKTVEINGSLEASACGPAQNGNRSDNKNTLKTDI
jgi:hypothetical protein